MTYPGYKLAIAMTKNDNMTPSKQPLTAGDESLSAEIQVNTLQLIPSDTDTDRY